ncbi:hypothetical protein BABINDRAFT_62137 [Babjeviella inositovora NRRL Y-12698]|uniref:CP-type G domain-containing protein n=1 Tax=Babjeviella inositovora NRRL Y-12698 TaxID=984486 RepID=A0A1E3QQA6_9ASCO|nr:uncharacterized protein BABINDRAFT_62137 [Babjeviella inositovora NRRL Y-12698]ODQ79828.1 hypothetical protein BABINDRAFT_62137 [Babjeviella inositovora NRRL Y-12698]
MRVRKPTSKRSTTRMKEGIKKKAAAQNRKNNKAARKDTTWKSRINKDPGIPASFPYKDRIVSQIEDKRREELERKQEQRAARTQARAEAAARGEMLVDSDEEDFVDAESNPLSALLESAQAAAKDYEGEESDDEEMSEEEDVEYDISDAEVDAGDVDKSRKAYDKIFKTVIEAADVILYVLDARDPEATRSKQVEEAVLQAQGKRLILILNKIDLVPADVLKQWLDFLKSSFPTLPLKATSNMSNPTTSYNKGMTQAVTSGALLKALKSYAAKSNLKRSIIVGVIGYPNVGKSSIINALTSRHGKNGQACPTGNKAGVTTSLREVKIDNKLKVLDSPGIVFPSSKQTKSQQEAKLALLSAIPPKAISDPLPAVQLLIKKLSKDTSMADAFKKYYSLPPISSSDVDEFTKQVLIHVSRKAGRLGRGGIPNLEAAAMLILTDWRDGRISSWTIPKNSKVADVAVEVKKSAPVQQATAAQTTIVAEWSKEFDLDGLLSGAFD